MRSKSLILAAACVSALGAQPLHPPRAYPMLVPGSVDQVERPGLLGRIRGRESTRLFPAGAVVEGLERADLLACAPDGRALAVVENTDGIGDVRILAVPRFGLRTSQPVQEVRYTHGRGRVTRLAWSDDGSHLAYGDETGAIGILDTRIDLRLADFRAHDSPVTGLAFEAGGRRLLSTSEGAEIAIWDLAGVQQSVRRGERDAVPRSIRLPVPLPAPLRHVMADPAEPGSGRLLALDARGTIAQMRIVVEGDPFVGLHRASVRVEGSGPSTRSGSAGQPAASALLAARGPTVARATASGITLWDRKGQGAPRDFSLRGGVPARALAVLPDRAVLVGTEDGLLELIAALPRAGEVASTSFRVSTRALTAIAVEPAGRWLAVGDDGGKLRFFGLRPARVGVVVMAHPGQGAAPAPVPSGLLGMD